MSTHSMSGVASLNWRQNLTGVNQLPQKATRPLMPRCFRRRAIDRNGWLSQYTSSMLTRSWRGSGSSMWSSGA